MGEVSLRTLGVPLRNVRLAWIGAAVSLLLYGITLQLDLGFFDSSELAMVARTGGLGHPTGQPLHTLLAWPLAHIPGLPPHLGVALLSALAGALCLVPALSILEELAPETELRWPVVALVVLMQHGLPWDSATRVEVYALTALCGLWALAWAVREDVRSLFRMGIGLGLMESTHPTLGVATAFALLPLWIERGRTLGFRTAAQTIGGGLLGLLPFAWVGFAVTRHPEVFVWGAPHDVESAKVFFTGADFAANQGITGAGLLDNFASLFVWLALEGGMLVVFVVGSIGWVLSARGVSKSVSILLLFAVLGLLAMNVEFDTAIPDYLGYLHVAWMASSVGVAALAAPWLDPLPETDPKRATRFRGYGVAILVACLLATLASNPFPWTRTRVMDDTARAMVDGLLEEVPNGALLVVHSDYWVGPLLYVTEVERRDVILLPWGFAGSSWYWEHLLARHPELRPFDLRGPGGPTGRVARFAEANPSRAILVEAQDSLLESVGRRVCGIGWAVHTGEQCPEELDAMRPARALRERLDRLGAGSPPVPNLVAGVTYHQAVVLWRMGRPNEALRTVVSGIADSDLDNLPDVRAAPPLRGGLEPWPERVPYGTAAQNAAFAAQLMQAAGQTGTLNP